MSIPNHIIKYYFSRLLIIFVAFCLLILLPKEVLAAKLAFQTGANDFAIQETFENQTDNWHLYFSPYLDLQPKNNTYLNISQAYADWQTGNFGLSFGRKIITFGPGRYGYPILGPLQSNPEVGGPPSHDLTAAGYDQIGYNFKWGNLKYHKFYATVPESGFRMLLGQRTTYDWGQFTFGFSETALVNEHTPAYIYLPFPFIPIYFYQFLGYYFYKIPGVNETINSAVDFDIIWQPNSDFKLYGEYYIDDRPWPRLDKNKNWVIPEWDRWWWKCGYQAGFEWNNVFKKPNLSLYTEYTRIDQYTYTAWHPGATEGWVPDIDWTYNGRYIGDSLGPDADRLNIELVWKQSPEWHWSFAYCRERHGEGKIGDHWYYAPGQTEVFLTGVVETTDILMVGLSQNNEKYELGLKVGLAWSNNVDHFEGVNGSDLRVSLIGKIYLP